MIYSLALLRHKLFNTEFVRITAGFSIFLRKVYYTQDDRPYVVCNSTIYSITEDDHQDDSYPNHKWIWLFKKRKHKCL